jgi:hypothetical protein
MQSFSSCGFVDHKNKHVTVFIHKTSQDKFYCEIEFVKSSEFGSLDNFWDAVKEIEELRKNKD